MGGDGRVGALASPHAPAPTGGAAGRFVEAWWAYAVLACYVALVGVMLLRHEPWFDEAQAWLLARDASPWSLFAHHLRYEGSPGLWHVILLLPAKAGLPYATLNVIAAALGSFAAYLLLRHSPFPPLVRALLPFTYFLLYQYAVVARSYALLAPLLFLLAIVWPERVRRVYVLTVLLVLLANVSAHGALIAGSLLLVHLLDVWRTRRVLGRDVLRRQLVAAGAFGLVTVLLILQLRPPPDLSNPVQREVGLSSLRTLGKVIDGTLTGFWPISLLAAVTTLLWFWRSGFLTLFLVPGSALVLFLTFIYRNPWHDGLVLLFTIFALWVSLADRRPRARNALWPRRLMLGGLLVVSAVQIAWTATSYRYDLSHSASGSEALARYIRAHGDGKTIYATNFVPSDFERVSPHWGGWPAFSVQPYFDHNVFANFHEGRQPSFWEWTYENDLVDAPRRILQARPDWIVLNIKLGGSLKQFAWYPGYRVLARFPGSLPLKFTSFEPDAYVLLERAPARAGTSSDRS